VAPPRRQQPLADLQRGVFNGHDGRGDRNLVTGDSPPSTVGLGRWFDPDSCGTISLQQREARPQPAGEGKRGGRVPPRLPPYPAQVGRKLFCFLVPREGCRTVRTIWGRRRRVIRARQTSCSSVRPRETGRGGGRCWSGTASGCAAWSPCAWTGG